MNSTTQKTITTQQVADRFNELAQQEKWFEIQEELFDDDVRSIDPEGSPYMKNARGKAAVREKGMNFVSKITDVHHRFTTPPVLAGNHFAVGREVDITHSDFGRIQLNEIMLYEVRDGKIVLEQFFYSTPGSGEKRNAL